MFHLRRTPPLAHLPPAPGYKMALSYCTDGPPPFECSSGGGGGGVSSRELPSSPVPATTPRSGKLSQGHKSLVYSPYCYHPPGIPGTVPDRVRIGDRNPTGLFYKLLWNPSIIASRTRDHILRSRVLCPYECPAVAGGHVHCTNNARLVVQTDGGSGRQTNGRDTIHINTCTPGIREGRGKERARAAASAEFLLRGSPLTLLRRLIS